LQCVPRRPHLGYRSDAFHRRPPGTSTLVSEPGARLPRIVRLAAVSSQRDGSAFFVSREPPTFDGHHDLDRLDRPGDARGPRYPIRACRSTSTASATVETRELTFRDLPRVFMPEQLALCKKKRALNALFLSTTGPQSFPQLSTTCSHTLIFPGDPHEIGSRAVVHVTDIGAFDTKQPRLNLRHSSAFDLRSAQTPRGPPRQGKAWA